MHQGTWVWSLRKAVTWLKRPSWYQQFNVYCTSANLNICTRMYKHNTQTYVHHTTYTYTQTMRHIYTRTRTHTHVHARTHPPLHIYTRTHARTGKYIHTAHTRVSQFRLHLPVCLHYHIFTCSQLLFLALSHLPRQDGTYRTQH